MLPVTICCGRKPAINKLGEENRDRSVVGSVPVVLRSANFQLVSTAFGGEDSASGSGIGPFLFQNQLAMDTFGDRQGQLYGLFVDAGPGDLDFTVGRLIARLSLGEAGDEVRCDVSTMDIVGVGVEVDAGDALDEPGADAAPEVVVQRTDGHIVPVKVLAQRGLATGNPLPVRGIGGSHPNLMSQVGMTELSQYEEDDSGAKNTGVQMVVLFLDLFQQYPESCRLFFLSKDVVVDCHGLGGLAAGVRRIAAHNSVIAPVDEVVADGGAEIVRHAWALRPQRRKRNAASLHISMQTTELVN